MTNFSRVGLVLLGLAGGVAASVYWRADVAQAQSPAIGGWVVAVAQEGQGVAWRLDTTTGYLEWCSPNTDATGLRCFGAPPLAP